MNIKAVPTALVSNFVGCFLQQNSYLTALFRKILNYQI